MKMYAIKMLDDSVRIMTIIAGEIVTELDKWGDKADVVSYVEITKDDVPSDRFFRNAWCFCEDNGISVSLDKAKEIKLDQFRELRKPLLEKTDIDFMKALESDASLSDIVAKKQALRDVTTVELPDDLVELKDFIPEVLK